MKRHKDEEDVKNNSLWIFGHQFLIYSQLSLKLKKLKIEEIKKATKPRDADDVIAGARDADDVIARLLTARLLKAVGAN